MKSTFKILSFILAIILLFSFASCNKNTNSDVPADDSTDETPDTTPDTDNKDDINDENKTPEGSDSENKEDDKVEEEKPAGKNIICQLKNSTHEQMMGYVFKTSDEKIIVIDGGTNGDTDNLYNTIKEMSGLEIPHVDAWILTHPHSDHIDAFMTIIEEKWDAIEIDKIYYNFPTEEFVAQYENSSLKTIQRFNSLKPKFEDKLVVSEVGDKYTIGEAKIDVLFVFDDTITFNPINNSSMIFRLTAGGKKMMFLGDAYVQAGQIVLNKYKVKLDSDYCQMAHHGQAGVNSDVYKIIAPSVCFWDAPDWLWDNDSGGGVGSGPWGTLTVRAWMESFKVELHVVEKDGNNYFDFDTGVLITK